MAEGSFQLPRDSAATPRAPDGEQRYSAFARWWPAILWAGVIFFASTHLFTAENTGRFIVPLLHWMFPALSPAALAHLHYLIRKCGHLTEYFIFSLLLLRGIRAGRRQAHLRWALLAILLVAAYASLDEFHQRFVPGRTPAVSDVVLDTIGGTIAQLVAGAAWLLRHRQPREVLPSR